MIYTGQQTLVRTAPRLLETLARGSHTRASFPAPNLLRELSRPMQPARPTGLSTTLRSRASLSISGSGIPGTNTLIGASVLGSLVARHFSRHFSSEKNSDTPSPVKTTTEPSVSEDGSGPSQPSKKLTRSNSVLVKQEPWSYSLYEVQGQYVLSVLCSKGSALYSLDIPLYPHETSDLANGATSVQELAAKIRESPSSYSYRHDKDFG